MKKLKPKHILLILLSLCLAALLLWALCENTALEITEYTVTSDALPESFDGFRIAQISDLHNDEFGADNKTLLALLRETAPDIIVITGDLADAYDTDIDIALRFAGQAVTIAPCYYITGNHESSIVEYKTLRSGLQALGVTVLENQRIRLEQDGAAITLVGVTDPGFRIDPRLGNADAVMSGALDGLTGSDTYTLLLAHRPEFFDLYTEFGADLVLSGHAHGGQFRLPFIGGLFAPGQGFFPEYDSGLYTQSGTTMVVSRGIGNSAFPLRFNNPPEIVVVTLRAAA